MVVLVASIAAMGLAAAEPERAKLLVGIVVDGLESDYLDLLRDASSMIRMSALTLAITAKARRRAMP